MEPKAPQHVRRAISARFGELKTIVEKRILKMSSVSSRVKHSNRFRMDSMPGILRRDT